jgi:excinuclease UvrABC nuclease subunit
MGSSQTSELRQLPGVTRKREQRLRDRGYIALWDIAEADIDELAEDLMIAKALAQQMIQTAQYLVLHE